MNCINKSITVILKSVNTKIACIAFILFTCFPAIAFSQDALRFEIAEFDADPFDLSAKSSQYEKYDGNGDRYAIIKVSSSNPNDKLIDYNFNFGNMKHIAEEHDGVLWLYVQRNAKMVTITRNGYAPINKYDLHTTIESGKNYVMSLTSEDKKVYTQIVQFNIKPANSNAVVMVKSFREGAQEELLGHIDASGSVAKNLGYGTYTYKVLADNYHMAEGRFTLNNRLETLVENVNLLANYSNLTFNVDADADIYINGEKKGTRQWSGGLKAGEYQVECRQANHKSTSQYVQVTENDNRTINLKAPEPILSIVSINSTPLGADITIDGKPYGQTPKNVEILVGNHTLELSKSGYKSETRPFEVQEYRVSEVNVPLGKTASTTINSNPENSELYVDGAFKGYTPYTFEGEVGEHKVKLINKGFKTLSKSVYLGNSNQLSFNLPKQLVKKTDSYLDLGMGLIQMPDPSDNRPISLGFAIGMHLSNINFEFSFNWLGVSYNDLDYNYFDNYINYRPYYNIGIKFGYGFITGNRFKITPQIGYKYTYSFIEGKLTYNDSADIGFSNVTIGARAFCSIYKKLGVSVTPEYSLGDIGGQGFSVRFAVSVTF